jgi:hypothetical protein
LYKKQKGLLVSSPSSSNTPNTVNTSSSSSPSSNMNLESWMIEQQKRNNMLIKDEGDKYDGEKGWAEKEREKEKEKEKEKIGKGIYDDDEKDVIKLKQEKDLADAIKFRNRLLTYDANKNERSKVLGLFLFICFFNTTLLFFFKMIMLIFLKLNIIYGFIYFFLVKYFIIFLGTKS